MAIHRFVVSRLVSTALLVLFCHIDAVIGFFGTNGGPRIPKSPSDRDAKAIASIQNAIQSPRTPSFPLIECEFPAVSQLNKLGDGSLRSSQEVDQANLMFCKKLVEALTPLPFLGPEPWLMMSSAANNALFQKAVATKLPQVHSLKEGRPSNLKGKSTCVFMSPSSRDYEIAKEIVNKNGNVVVLVNGLAKDTKSVPGDATMAYFLKPLTYNSQIAGYLVREFPGPWTTLFADGSDKTLDAKADNEILVPGTNTPDLRAAVRQVQVAVDEKAIQARNAR